MSDLTGWTPGAPGSAPAAAPAAPPPGSGGGGGGGGSDLTGWTPSGGTPTLTSASAAPTAAPAHHGGGHGGFGGFLRDAANFVNPTNIPHLVAGIGGAALASAHNTVDLAAGDITGNIPQHLRAQPGENFVNYFARVNPLIGGIVKGGQQTGVDVAGGVQGAAGLGQGGGGLLGRGFQHEAAQRWAAQPFNSLLGDAGTLALAAGPVAGALGAAGSAAGATAEGADTAATLAAAEAGVKAGEAVQGLSTSEEAAQAATRAQEAAQAARAAHAAPLARAGAGLTQTAAGAERVGGLAGRAMTAPFAPLRGAVLGGTLPVVGDLPGLADMVRANLAPVPAEPVPGILGNLAGRIAGVGQGMAGRVADVGQVAEARKYLADGPALRAAVERARLLQNAGEARSVLGADPEMEKALQLRTVLGGPQGVARILGPALAAGDEHATPILDAAGRQFMSDAQPISVHAARLAAGLGSSEEEAALTRAQTIRSEPITARGEEMLAGRGMLGGPMNPEQAGNTPLTAGVANATGPLQAAADAADRALTASRAAAGLRAQSLPALSDEAAQALADRVGIPVDAIRAEEARAAGPGPVVDAANRADAAHQALDQATAAAELNPANAPARFRPAIGMATTIARAMTDTAAAADKVTAGSGDLLRQGADTIPTTLRALADAGINPQHLIGSLDDTARAYGQGATRTVDLRLPRVAKLASENTKEAGIIPADLPAAVRPELARVSQVVANESAAPFQDRYGTTAGRVAGDTPEGRLMARAVEEAGYKAWNPRAWTETIPADQVNAATPIIPTALFHAFSEYWSPKPATGAAGLAGTVYDTLIRGGKNLTVALNPSYHAAVILGNTLKAAALGGENPAALIRGLADAVRMLRDDPANQLAVGAGRGSLSAEQADMLQALHGPRQGAGITSRLAAPAWKLSSYIQTVQRLGLTLAHINSGADPAAAVADAARVMGDFGKLAPWEQNTLRRVIPGYDFYKQITKLAVSLPIEHPARIAWLNYLTNAAGPAAQGAPPYFLNPLGMLGGLPSLALPIRGALALGGVKLNMAHPSKTRTLEEPPALAPDGQPLPTSGSPLARGPASVGETGYALGQLFPESRLYDALRSPNIHRYDTGEPRLTKTGPTAYPGGKLGGVLYALGLGGTQPAATAPTKAQAAFDKSQTTAAKTYAKRLATYTKTGK